MGKGFDNLIWFFGVVFLLGAVLIMVYFKIIYNVIGWSIILLSFVYLIFLISIKVIELNSGNWVNRKLDESKEMLNLRVGKESQLSLFLMAFAISLIVSGISSNIIYLTVMGMLSFALGLFHWVFQVQSRYKKLEEIIGK